MLLTPGTRIGHYEITGSLGAGGMGEVYRGRDTKLDRDVALKILPEVFAADPERRARFAREAKTLAALNHPNIAQIYGTEDSGTTTALVMELVEGDDLSVRIKRGPIPYDEAIAIAKQIVQALEAAHEQGIIHRDLKPANIKLRDDGTVKVLDFGLAKALDQPSAIGNQPSGPVENSPTITTPAMTLRGVILGTAAYMAPEQAKGRVVDKRADIWAFGCVLFEMLTGRRAFAGEDVSDTLASVLKSDADWTGVPRPAVRLLKKCLEKDPRKRLHDIGDAWDLIDDATPVAPAAATRVPWLSWVPAALLLVSTVGLAVLHFTEQPATPRSARFQISPPPKNSFDIYLALSPDGRTLAYTARDESGGLYLWVRDLESLEARRLPGTEGAWSPFWSPDGNYLAFGVDRALKKIALTGGPAQTITEVPAIVGLGSWNRDGVIIFGTRGAGPLRRVPASGGAAVDISVVDSARGETFHSFPFFLPDGRRYLYYRQSADAAVQGVYVGSLDAAPAEQSATRVTLATSGPLAAASDAAGTRILFLRDATLMAQSFDIAKLSATGEPTPIAEQIGRSGSFGFFTAAADVLAYRHGTATATTLNRLTWVDRKGQTVGTVGEAGQYSNLPTGMAISPDARQAIVSISPTPSPDLWVLEFARAIQTRFTFHDAQDQSPVWSPDGARLAFRSTRQGAGDIFVKDVTGTTDEKPILQTAASETPTDWSHDDRFLLYTAVGKTNTSDIAVLSLKGAAQPTPILETQFSEGSARFSPDDRWIAYVSNESGDTEVYLRPFTLSAEGKPTLGAKWRVSTDGGQLPHWRRDGRELFYRNRAGAIMAVDVSIQGTSVETGVPKRLFTPSAFTNLSWDVAPDGQRFLIAMPVDQAPNLDPITVVLNWK